MKTLAKALLVLLALLPVGILLWLAVPQLSLLWGDRAYWRGYAVSLGLTAVILLFQLAVALPAAYGLARWRGRLRDAAYLLYCLLTLLPVQVMLLPNYLVCRALGPLNTQLAIVLLGVFSPLSVFLLARAMQRIGVEQSEAASLDGAGAWTIFRRIYLPQVRDTAYIAAGLAFLDQWSMVELPLVLLSDESKLPLSILLDPHRFRYSPCRCRLISAASGGCGRGRGHMRAGQVQVGYQYSLITAWSFLCHHTTRLKRGINKAAAGGCRVLCKSVIRSFKWELLSTDHTTSFSVSGKSSFFLALYGILILQEVSTWHHTALKNFA